MDSHSYNSHDSLINILNACALACNRCFSDSLAEHHISELAHCIKLTVDCAAICRLTQSLIASHSEFGGELVDVCSDACAACARECEKHEHEHCRICAEACRQCEEACENFAPSTL